MPRTAIEFATSDFWLQRLSPEEVEEAQAYQHLAFKINEEELAQVLEEADKVEELLAMPDYAPGLLVCSCTHAWSLISGPVTVWFILLRGAIITSLGFWDHCPQPSGCKLLPSRSKLGLRQSAAPRLTLQAVSPAIAAVRDALHS